MSALRIFIWKNYETGEVYNVDILSHHRGHVATYCAPTLKEVIAEWRKYRYATDVKYVVAGFCDQTHWYLADPDWAACGTCGPYGSIVHSEAVLFDTLEEAQKAKEIFDTDAWIEVVSHVEEFQSREDTW